MARRGALAGIELVQYWMVLPQTTRWHSSNNLKALSHEDLLTVKKAIGYILRKKKTQNKTNNHTYNHIHDDTVSLLNNSMSFPSIYS